MIYLSPWLPGLARLEIGETYEVEFRLRRKDGVYRWFLGRAVPARDELGRIIRWIGTSTDVHDQKTISAELAVLNATLAERVQEKTRERDRIWNVSRDLLAVADLDGTLRSVNPAWTNTLGWTEQELLNKQSDWLEHPDDREKVITELDNLNRGRPTIRFEGRLRPPGWFLSVVVLDCGSRRRSDLCGCPRCDRGAGLSGEIEGHRGSVASIAEDGGGRSAHRRHRS